MASFDKIYFFGASDEDSGNQYDLTNQTVPLSPPNFDGRNSNGLVWTEYLAEDVRPQTEVPFSLVPQINVNYAVGGAQSGSGETDLITQVRQYIGDIERAELFGQSINSADDLYIISSGPAGNDIRILGEKLADSNSGVNLGELPQLILDTVETAATNIVSAIVTLHQTAGAKEFLVLNAQDLEFYPQGQAFLSLLSASGLLDLIVPVLGPDPFTALTELYNEQLEAALDALVSNPALDIKINQFDFFAQKETFEENFENSSEPYLTFNSNQEPLFAEGSPDEYLFWDGGHFTTDGYALLANLVGDTLFEDFKPNVAINEIKGSRSDDSIKGTSSSDKISGDLGNDTLIGGRGNDIITGGRGGDRIFGGRGNDILAADRLDRFDSDASLIKGGRGSDIIYGGRKNDTLKGGRGNDVLLGKDGNDILHGDRGNDLLNGGVGNDTLKGGEGIDTADYSDLSFESVFSTVAGLDVNLKKRQALHSSSNNSLRWRDTLRVENVIGTSINDRFIGNEEDNVFDGQGEVERDCRTTKFVDLDGDVYQVSGDVVEFEGTQSDYIIAGSIDQFTVAGALSGTDTLIDIEFLKFGDDAGVVAVETLLA